MQIRFLLNDHTEKVHDDVVRVFDEQVTLGQLKEFISDKWNIPEDDFNFFLGDGVNANKFDLNSHLPEIGLQHMDEIVVKHALCLRWEAYLSIIEIFRKAKNNEYKRSTAKEAAEYLKEFKDSGYFSTYPKHRVELSAIKDECSIFLDSVPEYSIRLSECNEYSVNFHLLSHQLID